MNNEIKELVERVRLTSEEISEYFNEGLGKDWDITGLLQAQLNKIFNDPDLYLQVTGEKPILTIDLGKGDETYCSIDYIPLAEELEKK